MQLLQQAIEILTARNGEHQNGPPDAHNTLDHFLDALNAGTIRAADVTPDGFWHVNTWVKHGIMLAFRLGRLSPVPFAGEHFLDRDTLPIRRLGLDDGVRLVPGGTSVRSGAYIAPGVVVMPPSYVNIGAYVGTDCMIDSHVLVGSCAQIGNRVHLSAGVQVGGVLEPAGAMPVIVEDEVFVGGGCGLFEGVLVRKRAVLAPGVTLTGSTRLYDLVNECIIERDAAGPLEVPAGAVVVPGSRPAMSDFGRSTGVQLYTPVIVKYRDEKTDASTALTSELRGDG
jgi:2,3,4,5-tetrahydropyridine-2-carboxylate N-succinyltransferase